MSNTPPSPPQTSAFQGCVCVDDIFEVMVQDDSGTISFLPAVVWSVCDDGFEVFYLTRCHPQHADPSTRGPQIEWALENQYHRIPWQAVNAHVPLAHFEGDKYQQRKRAMRTLGFRDLGTCDRFYKIAEEQLLETVPTLRARQVHVVPDAQVELFRRAPPGTSAFVDDMHSAQTAFTAWRPSNESEQRTKDLLESLDTRICRQEANRAWERGRAL